MASRLSKAPNLVDGPHRKQKVTSEEEGVRCDSLLVVYALESEHALPLALSDAQRLCIQYSPQALLPRGGASCCYFIADDDDHDIDQCLMIALIPRSQRGGLWLWLEPGQ